VVTEGNTPSGGVKTVAAFTNNGQPCDRSEADMIEIMEYDAKGKVVMRTYLNASHGADSGGPE
jgi:hypothetical protein